MKKSLKILCLAFGVAAILPTAEARVAGPRPSITASIDSTSLTQGSKAMLSIEAVNVSPGAHLVDMPEPGNDYFGIELSELTIDTIALENGRTQLRYNYVIQAFDPGTVTLPPFRFSDGADTIESKAVALKVLEVDLDSLTDIHPMDTIVSVPSKWYDFIPDVWIYIILGIIGFAVLVCCLMLLRKKKQILSRPVKVTPPYDLAVMRLNALQSKKLPQSGKDKEYYTELTDILRQYLDGRFGINAMEMTSTQIIDTLRHNKETRPGTDLMKQILAIADFVKFAKVRPLPEDNIKSFNAAVKFVEDSKPLPPVEGDGQTTDKTDNADNNSENK